MNSVGGTDLIERLRLRYIRALAILSIASGALGLIAQIIVRADSWGFIPTGLVLFIGLALLWLVRHKQTGIASALMLIVFVLMALTSSSTIFPLMATFALVSVSVLGANWVYGLVNFIIFGKMTYDIIVTVQAYTGSGASSEGIRLAILMVALGIVSFILRYFIGKTEEAIQATRGSARLLEAAAETGQVIGKLLTLNEVLPRAVELIRERFDFYHVQIFMVDETGQNARLVASSGDIGRRLLEREHSLRVGSQSVIGQASASGKAVIVRDTDPTHRRNELLPLTRAEAGLPIFDGDKIIGILDVQSRHSDAFSIEVVQALVVLVNLLSTSIRNARLFEAQEASARDSKRLFLEAETNLHEVQRLNQQLSQNAWSSYLQAPKQSSGVTVAGDEVVQHADWSATLSRASQTQHPVSEIRDGQRVIAVPMMLGNQVIGAIEVEADAEQQDAEITELVNAVSQRLAISLDKARLFEESQEATLREQQINQIVGRYQTVTNVDDLLRITLQELSQSLGATRAAIRLGAAPVAELNGEGHS